MGKYTVTQEQWKRVMGNNPSYFRGDRLPVDQVNWTDCQAFIQALNRIIAASRLKAALPTEAQWEYACRAGTQTRFYGGDGEVDLARAGWFSGNSGNKPHEVGQKQKNASGLYDMHGNVWEWCQDWIAMYPREPDPAVDPRGPATGSDRVLRGGAWNADADLCRAAYRFSYPPQYRIMTAGFRIVAMPDASPAQPDPPPLDGLREVSLFRSAKVNVVSMPIEESLRYRLIARLNRKASVYQGLKRQTAVLLSHECAGDAYALFIVDPENPLIERPVMQLAECDAVFHVIRAAERTANERARRRSPSPRG